MPPLAALALASFATGTQSFVFGGLLDEMARDLGVSVGVVGQLATIYAAVVALGAPFAASVAGRFERRAVLAAALVAMAAANLAAVFAPGYAALLALRIAAALAACVITPLATTAAMAVAPPERRGRAFAIVTGGITIALVLGVPMGSVVGAAFGWRASFAFAAALVLAAAAALRLSLPRLPAPPAAERRPIGEALRLPAVRAALAFTLLGFTAIFSVAAYLGPIATRATGLGGAAIGGFQAAVGIGAIIGVMLGGRIAERSRGRAAPAAIFLAMLLTLLAYAPLLRLGPHLPAPAAAATLALIVLLGAGALFTLIPLAQVRLAAAAPQAGPVLFGLNGSMVFAGQGAGALLGGVVAETLGYAAIGPAGAAVAALALAVIATAAPPAGSSATAHSRQ